MKQFIPPYFINNTLTKTKTNKKRYGQYCETFLKISQKKKHLKKGKTNKQKN